jgi:hypothetical protein
MCRVVADPGRCWLGGFAADCVVAWLPWSTRRPGWRSSAAGTVGRVVRCLAELLVGSSGLRFRGSVSLVTTSY